MVLINKWIISNRFLRYTPFWYWFRLINHSDFRMDDNVRNRDFWLNLNSGWEDMNCKWEFEKFWGKGSYPPERIFLKEGDFNALVEQLNLPSDATIEAVKRLMNRKTPFEND